MPTSEDYRQVITLVSAKRTGPPPLAVRQVGRSQVLVVHACPLSGPLPALTGWTMPRAFTLHNFH